MDEYENENILPKGTLDSLINELNLLPILDKKSYLDDWIIRYASTNPVFEEIDDPNELNAYLFVKDDPNDPRYNQIQVVGDSFGWDTKQYSLEKLKNTDWFFIKFKRPYGTSLHYLLSPIGQSNDRKTYKKDKSRVKKTIHRKLDNRNKNTAMDIRNHSVAKFPGFVPFHKLSDKNVDMTELRLPKKLQGTRSGHFAVIKKEDEKIKKLLIVHDGAPTLKFMKIDRILKFGIDNDRWPSIALVTMSIEEEDRHIEYGGGRSQYTQYFREHILPTIENYLDKSFKANDIILYGSSLSAWASFDILWNNSDRIKHAICQNCPWWWPDRTPDYFIKEVKNSKKKNIGRIYFDSGIFETPQIQIKSYESYGSSKKMMRALKEKKYNYLAKEYHMGNRYYSWAWAFPYALDFIIDGKKNYQPPTGREMQ